MTKTNKTQAQPATIEPDAQGELTRAQAKLDGIESTRAELATRIDAARIEAAGATTPDALQVAELEIANLELRARALRNAHRVATLERDRARGASAVAEFREVAKVAASAQRELKIRADAHARALQALLRTQTALADAAKDFDRARRRVQELAAATGQPEPKLHRADGPDLATALVRDAQWAVGLRGGILNGSWCAPRKTLAEVVHAVRKDLHQQVLHELHTSMPEAEQLQALLDDSYRDHVNRIYGERETRSAELARAPDERADELARERKAARQAGRSNFGGVLV